MALSRCMASPLQRVCMRRRCAREAVGWVSRKYLRIAPAAPIPAVRPRQPNPSSECTANCVWSNCAASLGLKVAAGCALRRGTRRRVRHDPAFGRESGWSTSRGSSRASSSMSWTSACAPWNSVIQNSPVETSRQASPMTDCDLADGIVASGKTTAARKCDSPGERNSVSIRVPGVYNRTTSRRTRPFASFGSSTCSQSATVRPALRSFAI